MKHRLIITIDGPAGAGKTTMARLLAVKLDYLYLDTGAMYRAITLKAMNMGLDLNDENALVKLARDTKMRLNFKSKKIRSREVTANVHYLAGILGVREVMWRFQRKIGEKGGIVADGRDMGTVVFPMADIKFYLEAKSTERAKRRQKDFSQLERKVILKDLEKEILARDRKDKGRKIAPLKKAKDSIVIDTTALSIPQVLGAMFRVIASLPAKGEAGEAV